MTYKLFNSLILQYYDLVHRNEKENEESDFEELSENILLPFINEYLKLDSQWTSSDSEIIVSTISSVRKDIHSIKLEALEMANQVESRRNLYFEEESTQIKKIEEIQNALKLTIRARKINKLKNK